MKKNKKYWKKEAKGWKEVARIESEEANKWAAKAIQLEEELEIANEACTVFYDQIEDLEEKIDNLTNKPTETIKPGAYYNIPCPPIWQVQYPPTPPSITTTGTSYKEMNITPKKCNCNCNCKK